MPELLLNAIKPFRDAIKNSDHLLKILSEKGQKCIGYFCSYTPVEIIHAAGFIPVRMKGGTGHVDQSSAHVPDFICPFMKLSLEKAIAGRYDFLSGLVNGYSCDAACGMVNIWKDIFPFEIFHPIPIPYNDTSESRKFFKSAMDEFIDKLDAMGGKFTESTLNNSLDIYHQIRKLLLTLYERRYDGRLPISSNALMSVIDAGFLLPPEEYLFMLKDFMNKLPETASFQKNGCPVLITGSLIEDPGIFDIIESCGGRVVSDDLCNGFRPLFPADGKGKYPMDRLIDRYINRFSCPARSRANQRSREILNLMKQSGAKGIIFMLQKFCTPHLADYPTLSNELKKEGFPSLLIEMDETWQMEGQLRTRLEGFFEMFKS
jgi:benzoyl-CoA reductase/2-hydroxyglutaryl-CoA dehydratase subunit BcrC/BadD/HgdB